MDRAIIARRFLGGEAEGVDQARDLTLAVGDRLARLDAQRIGEFVEPLLKAPDAMGQHIALLIAREARSEEHTSELQSLMRISYAVFCLKKKKNKMTKNTTNMIKTSNRHYKTKSTL